MGRAELEVHFFFFFIYKMRVVTGKLSPWHSTAQHCTASTSTAPHDTRGWQATPMNGTAQRCAGELVLKCAA